MKYLSQIIFVFMLFSASFAYALPAFPGAEGAGADTAGGRGGTVYIVTTLADSGSGSFREAVTAQGPRIVVFAVSGHIHLLSDMDVLNPYLTVAGQTSPGGVSVSGGVFNIETHDVIITHIRFRIASDVCDTLASNGDGCDTHGDSLRVMSENGHPAYNVIIDHCSMSWGCDETLDVGDWYGDTSDVTVSNCLIAQGLDDPAPESQHALGFMAYAKYKQSKNLNISVHHNYMAHFRYRFPEVGEHVNADIRNNVIYNWEKAINTNFHVNKDSDTTVNLVHNYYKPGLLMSGHVCGDTASEGFMCDESDPIGKCNAQAATAYKVVYINGNLGCGRSSQSDPDGVNAKLRAGWSPGGWISSDWISATPFPISGIPVTTTAMNASYANTIVANAGATKPVRDSLDAQYAADFAAGTGSVLPDVHFGTNVSTTYAWPVYNTPSAPPDSDKDGMADAWETSAFGSTSRDGKGDFDTDGYTDVEEYLHYLGGYWGGTGESGESCVSAADVSGYIAKWHNGEATLVQLLSAIIKWKIGC
jgi:pectate lyase